MSNRDLDALVAEKIFGYTWWVSTPKPDVTPTPQHVTEILGMRFLREARYVSHVGLLAQAIGDEPVAPFIGRLYTSEFPHYSTDPAAGQQLKDKMRADGWKCSMTDSYTSENKRALFSLGRLSEGTHRSGDWWEVSELRAVVIAALRTYGVEVPE